MKGLLTSLITVLTFTGLQAQSLPTAPKLVVGLTIDQLRTDYLEAFSSLYGERGFKRLWKEGRVFHNAEYTFSGVDRASAMAAIYSGSTPSGSIPRPENGAERLIMANSPGGQANITTVRPSTPASPASHGNRFSHVVCTLSCQIGGT